MSQQRILKKYCIVRIEVRKFGFRINLVKTNWGQTEVKYYYIDSLGTYIDLYLRSGLYRGLPTSQIISEFRKSRGMINFYRKFHRGTTETQAPYAAPPKAPSKRGNPLFLGRQSLERAFAASRKQLSPTVLLRTQWQSYPISHQR